MWRFVRVTNFVGYCRVFMEQLQYEHTYWCLLTSHKSCSSFISCGRNAVITSPSVWSRAIDEVYWTACGWMRIRELVRELLWGKAASGHVDVPIGTLFCTQLLQPVNATRESNFFFFIRRWTSFSWRFWPSQRHPYILVIQFLIFIWWRSCIILSSHLFLGLPFGLLIKGFHLSIFLVVLISGILYMWPNQPSLRALM